MLVLTYIMGRLWQLVYKENEPNFECIFGLFFIDENSKLLSRFYLSFFSGPSKYFFGEGDGNPLQYSCLENPVDSGAWWAAVYGAAQSRTRLKRLSSSSQVLFIIYLSLCWVFIAASGVSLIAQSSSQCGGLSLPWFSLLLPSTGPRALTSWLWLVGLGLAVPQHVGSLQIRDGACVPCIDWRVLNHWTTREVLLGVF